MHDDDDDAIDKAIDSSTFGKPDIILFCSSTKEGVDTVDKYKEHSLLCCKNFKKMDRDIFLFSSKYCRFVSLISKKISVQLV